MKREAGSGKQEAGRKRTLLPAPGPPPPITEEAAAKYEEGKDTVNDFFTMMEKLQGMLDSEDVEIVTNDGQRFRGRIDNLRSTQPFSRPAVKILGPDGRITKILFTDIKEMINHQKNNG